MMRLSGLLLAASLCAQAHAADVPVTPQTPAELQSRLAAILKQNHIPGAGVALFDRDGIIWAGGVGEADTTTHKPITADTLFRVGSITKSFVSVALLQLAEQGKLDLNAKLKDLAPEIPVSNPWEDTDPVTVAEVLEHTAGFDDMHFPRLYNFSEAPDIALLTVLQRSQPELRVRWKPGTRMSYSNDDYLIAGYLLEKLSGERYEQYVTDHVLKPLDMPHASLTLDTATLAGLAQGYEGDDQHAVKPVSIYLRPAGALNASPVELAHLGVMLLNRGQWHNVPVLRAASVTRMETPMTGLAGRQGLSYGYGLANYSSYIGGYEFHGHNGGIDGFISRYVYAPDQGIGFVLLVNSSDPGEAFHDASTLIVSYLMHSQPQPLQPPTVRVDPSVIKAMTGFYREQNPRNQVIAVIDYLFGVGHLVADGKGGLQLRSLSGKPDELVPAGTDLWRKSENAGPDTVFYQSPDGQQVLDFEVGAGGPWLVKTNAVSAYGPLLLVGVACLLMLSTVAFAPVWVVRKFMGRMHDVRHWSVRLLPLAATAAFGLMLMSLMNLQPIQLGTANVHTVGLFLSSLFFALLSAGALAQSLRAWRWHINPWLRWHSLSAALACFGLTLFLSYWGLIGLRMWSF
jgi:CubicO group peptidase (beta-lactamase class C family)